MAERLSDVITKIQNVQQLKAVVTAMRGIAASRAQNGRALLAGIEAHTTIISRAIGEALALLPTDIIAAPAPTRSKRASSSFVRSRALPDPSASVCTKLQGATLRGRQTW